MPHPNIESLKFAPSITITAPSEGVWYHYFDWPDGTSTRGRLDFRNRAADYLGHVDFAGKSVLEIGPASGFLTKEMSLRGASVTSIDLPDDCPWEAVPRTDMKVSDEIRRIANGGMKRQRASWWYAQQQFKTNARVAYCGLEGLKSIPDRTFDIVLIASVLQHMREPISALYAAGRIADTVIVSELLFEKAEATKDGAYFQPSPDNRIWGSWWGLSSGLINQVMMTAGFSRKSFERHVYRIWNLKTDSDSTDSYADRQFHISVFEASRAPKR